jgi:hypothetical protein
VKPFCDLKDLADAEPSFGGDLLQPEWLEWIDKQYPGNATRSAGENSFDSLGILVRRRGPNDIYIDVLVSEQEGSI